ncbi:MAG: hypothetical protein LBC25_02105, partial [Holosporales bacterium]|nr:hypothetical protein [Holosporales bacterium]
MNRKVLGIIGVLAVGVVDAGASCPGYNGGYIGLKFGTAVQTAKHKKAEKKVKVKEDATYVLKEAYFDKAGLEAAVQSVHDAQIPDPAVAFPDALFNAAVVGAGDHNLLNAPVPDLAVFNAGMSALLAAKIAAAKAAFGIADDQIVLPVFTDVQQGSRVISAGSVSGYEIFSAQGTQAAPENFNGTAARVVVTAATVCRTQFLTDVFGGDTAAAIGTKFNERFDRIVFHAADDFYKAAENGEAKDQVRDFTVPESKCQAHKQAGLLELEAGFCKSCN